MTKRVIWIVDRGIGVVVGDIQVGVQQLLKQVLWIYLTIIDLDWAGDGKCGDK